MAGALKSLFAKLSVERAPPPVMATSLDPVAFVEHMKSRRFTAAWNALAPKRIAAIRYGEDAIHVLHPTKGWRRLSHKRLGFV